MNKPQHIFQLTAKDFEELAAAVNPSAGLLVRITKKHDTVEIAVDESAFKVAIWAFYRNGGFNQSTREGVLGTSLVPPS